MEHIQIDAQKLREARLRAGFSIHGAARELKKFPQAISRIETGKMGMNGNLLARFCVLYKVQISDLLKSPINLAA